MGELDTIRLDKAVRLIKKYGYVLRAIKGSHHIFIKKGCPKIVIPRHDKEVKHYIVSQIIDILGLSKEEFLKEIKKL